VRISSRHNATRGLAIVSVLLAFPAVADVRSGRADALQPDESAVSRVYVVAVPEDEAEPPETVEVYETDDEEAREESAGHLARALSDENYRHAVRVVQSPALADVIVEITWRGSALAEQRVSFGPIPSGGGVSIGTPQRMIQNNMQVRLLAGEREAELFAIEPGDKTFLGQLRMLDWEQLAEEAAARIVAWIGGAPGEATPDDPPPAARGGAAAGDSTATGRSEP